MKARIDAVSTQLYVLAVRHPSEKVRNRAIEAGEALTRAAFTSLRYVAQHSQDPDSSSEAKSTAVAIYRDARIALTDLVDAVREN
jgi:hypothetical protein